MINKIQQAFDRAATSYDTHCVAQQHAGIKLTQQLKSLQPQADRLLDLGCGTGITTQLLARKYDYTDFYAVDFSSALLAKAKDRLAKFGITTAKIDFDTQPNFNMPFDIVYSNMAFQWSKDLSSLFAHSRSLLNSLGCLAFSLPLSGTFKEIQSQCALNSLQDEKSILNMLLENGYQILANETEAMTLTFPHTRHALKSIKQVGANYVEHRTRKGLSPKSLLEKMKLNELTYVIGYFIARKEST